LAAALQKAFRFLASYGLACVLFLLLLVLTYLGTLHQVDHGLYETQQKYFNSAFLVHEAFGFFPVPLPGGYLVVSVLFINLVCGGILRARRGWSQLGMLSTHAGICVLLAGSFITYQFADGGHLTLYEGEASSAFESYHEWEIAVAEAGGAEVTEYLIPEDDFAHVGPGRSRSFELGDAPFTLTVSGYVRNAAPQPATQAGRGKDIVDGFYLLEMPPQKEDAANAPGAYAAIREQGSGAEQRGLLWGHARAPWTVTAAGKTWHIALRKRRWTLGRRNEEFDTILEVSTKEGFIALSKHGGALGSDDQPFIIKLEKFTRELHPGTNTPRVFRSDVTLTEGGVSRRAEISMNEPLRQRGYALYQSSWGPANAGPGDPLYSTLAVVRNPADQFPLYACVIVTLGLAIHFSRALVRYVARESRRAS